MLPHDFLLSTFQRVVPHSFGDVRLHNKETSERLCLDVGDSASLAKFRVSAITMVLAVSLRGAQEACMQRYGGEFKSTGGFVQFMSKSWNLFDAIVELEVGKAVGLPSYADAGYFQRWRFRFNEQIMAPDAHALRPTSLIAFLRQASFAYEAEPRVAATDTAVLAQGEDVYDNYVLALRNLLGQSVLR